MYGARVFFRKRTGRARTGLGHCESHLITSFVTRCVFSTFVTGSPGPLEWTYLLYHVLTNTVLEGEEGPLPTPNFVSMMTGPDMLEWTGPMLDLTRTQNGWLSVNKDGTPPLPPNTTLRHLIIPSHHPNVQQDRNGLEYWLHRNRSSHPRRVKWLALITSEEERTQAVLLAVSRVPALLPTILEILDKRWYEMPFEHPHLPLAHREMYYSVHLHKYPPGSWRQKRLSLDWAYSLFCLLLPNVLIVSWFSFASNGK